MKQGCSRQQDICTFVPKGQTRIHIVPNNVPVGEHGAFGQARRARGIHDEKRVMRC